MKEKHRGVFVTDFGRPMEMVDSQSGKVKIIERYGIWHFDESKRKNQCFKVSGNLEEIFTEFGEVPVLNISRVMGEK